MHTCTQHRHNFQQRQHSHAAYCAHACAQAPIHSADPLTVARDKEERDKEASGGLGALFGLGSLRRQEGTSSGQSLPGEQEGRGGASEPRSEKQEHSERPLTARLASLARLKRLG